MKSESIHTSNWAVGMLDQGRVIEGHRRVLIVSGQASVVDDPTRRFGFAPLHAGDMRAQFKEALSNLKQVIEQAEMTVDDIVQMRYYVTDMEAGLDCAEVVLEWFGESLNRPPQSFLGVNALFLPELMVEIEALAATD